MNNPENEATDPKNSEQKQHPDATTDTPWTYELEPADSAEERSKHSPPSVSQSPSPTVPAEDEKFRTPASVAEASTVPFVGGFGKLRATLWMFGAVLLLALVIAGVRAGDGTLTALAAALVRVVLTVAVSGMIGTLAAIAAARCLGTRVAEPELFAVRMLTASAAFSLLYETGTPIPSRVDDWLLGAAGFTVVVWFLFRLTFKQTGLVLAWHAGMMLVIWLAAWLAAAAPRGTDAVPNPPVPEFVPSTEQLPPGVG